MKKIILLLLTVFSLCALVNGTYASLLYIEPGSHPDYLLPQALPLNDTHDVAVTSGAVGWYNANLYATADVTLTYEYLGFEAGWTNAFIVDGSEAFRNRGTSASSVGDTATSSAAAGSLLNFAFEILAGGNAGYGVINGDNVPPMGTPNDPDNRYSAPNFFLGYVDASHDSVYIALDDGGGPHWSLNTLADDNHDDLVLKVTATAVPEPATLILLGTGLVGIGAFRNKFKK